MNNGFREAIGVSNQQTAILRFFVYAFLQICVSCTTNIAVAEAETMTLSITSTAFEEGGSIPAIYTCEGDDISPPLSFSGVSELAQTLALIVDDPDAPDPKAPRTTWVHWVLYNIPIAVSGMVEDTAKHGLPPGTSEGKNDWGRTAYGGPCPPIGRHRYFHKLYALDVKLPDLQAPTKAELERAMQGHVLATASVVGTYQKSR
jgi:hypothetical protein